MVVARPQGDDIRVDHIATVPLDLDSQESNVKGLGEQLAKALGSQRLPKSQALTAIGRSLIELRLLKLPPAPDDELPEMVRFQAMQEFSSLKQESPLDFLPLGDAATEPGEVMAAAISTDLVEQVESALSSQGHEPHRFVMRPCAAASLAMRRQAVAAIGITLIISLQADSAELAIVKNGTVVFTRSFRLPHEWQPNETGEPLLGEVRRTIAAAQNQLGGSRVERIVFFGAPQERSALCQRLEERTKLDVALLDPFEGVSVPGQTPDRPERFAALLGMLHDEANEVRPVIDFKHPRKKPKPESNRRLHVLLATTTATVVIALCSLVYYQFSQLEAQVQDLGVTLNRLNRENKQLQSTMSLAAELNIWKKSDHNWLDELVHLSSSEDLTAEHFRLESLTARSRNGFPGIIEINGRARDLTSQQTLQNELSDEHHDIIPGASSRSNDGDELYPLVFTTTVRTNRATTIELPKPNQDAAPHQLEKSAARPKKNDKA